MNNADFTTKPLDTRIALTFAVFNHADLPISTRQLWCQLIRDYISVDETQNLGLVYNPDQWTTFCRYWADIENINEW